MNIAGLQPALPRNEVAERIALQKIAVVDKNAVTDFGTRARPDVIEGLS
jgi:hypothetical protein